jgi:hypothetical protein
MGGSLVIHVCSTQIAAELVQQLQYCDMPPRRSKMCARLAPDVALVLEGAKAAEELDHLVVAFFAGVVSWSAPLTVPRSQVRLQLVQHAHGLQVVV